MAFFSSIMTVLAKGGPVMYPLAACSVAMLAVAIERRNFYRRAETDVAALLAGLDGKLRAGDWQAAAAYCAGTEGAAAAVLAQGLAHWDGDAARLQHGLEAAAALMAARLRRWLNLLDTIVTLAPLLGLLGTVIGMINSFSVLSLKAGQPLVITGGIAEALVATAAGLCVALAALVLHSYFAHRLDIIVTDMEEACGYVLQRAGGKAS